LFEEGGGGPAFLLQQGQEQMLDVDPLVTSSLGVRRSGLQRFL
jgi:hypothetical protein